MTTGYERIDALTDDQVLEAVNLLSGEVLGPKPDPEVRAEVASIAGVEPSDLDTALAAAAPKEVAELGRAMLVMAVASGREREVEEAIDAVGQKALLIELAVIGLLALGALHTLRTKGKKEETREQETTVAPDGTVTIKTTTAVKYFSVGESLAPFAEKLVKAVLSGS